MQEFTKLAALSAIVLVGSLAFAQDEPAAQVQEQKKPTIDRLDLSHEQIEEVRPILENLRDSRQAVFARPARANNERPAIVSAYLGGLGEAIPPGSLASVSGCPQSPTDDGMPIDLNVQIDASSLRPEHFRVVNRVGIVSTPNCATLRPANEPNELSTILLTGPFVPVFGGMPNPADLSAYVLITGPVKDLSGKLLTGLVSPPVTIGAQSGPSLIRAKAFLKPKRPAGASPLSIQLVWAGGVTGPFGAELGPNQLNAIRIIDRNGNVHTPLAFDDLGDGDNFVELFISTDVLPERIEIRPGLFFDPMNFPNPATAIQVTWPDLGRLQKLLEQ